MVPCRWKQTILWFLLAEEAWHPSSTHALSVLSSSRRTPYSTKSSSILRQSSASFSTITGFSSSPESTDTSYASIGTLEHLRIQGEDASFAGNMGVPTFALRNAHPQKFAKNNSPTKEVRPRGLEACLQPASHGPAFVLDQVLSPQTCRELMALMDPHFGSFAAGKNHHGKQIHNKQSTL